LAVASPQLRHTTVERQAEMVMAKYEAKTKPNETSVADFIESLPDPSRREDAQWVDSMMRRVSVHEPRMWGPTIIGYGQYHYRYDSGHEGEAPRLGFSPRKAELVLYVLGVDSEGRAEEEELLGRLGKHRTGKSCLYIRRLEQVDREVLEQLATLSWETMAKRYPN
jgi:hypothetical protein